MAASATGDLATDSAAAASAAASALAGDGDSDGAGDWVGLGIPGSGIRGGMAAIGALATAHGGAGRDIIIRLQFPRRPIRLRTDRLTPTTTHRTLLTTTRITTIRIRPRIPQTM